MGDDKPSGYQHSMDWSEQFTPGDMTPAKPGAPSRDNSKPGRSLTQRPFRDVVEQRAIRRLERQQMDAGSALARESPMRKELPGATSEEIEAVLRMFASVRGRSISLRQDDGGRRFAIQRCRACRADITTPIFQTMLVGGWRAELGTQIRHDYDSHLCEPVEPHLVGLTNEQMDELLASTERELEMVAKRYEAIKAAFARQLAAKEPT